MLTASDTGRGKRINSFYLFPEGYYAFCGQDAVIRRQLWMNKRYRLCDVEEAVSEMEELMDIEMILQR